jgi:transcriptional regulator with XRE-family HTH domain
MIGLGRILAETREARGVALEDVERETRIARRYLLALEEEDFSAFPAQVQARGFLRLYSQYLGLDAAEMLALFPNEVEVETSDGLIHSDRIFREQREPSRPTMPTLHVERQPLLAGLGVAALLIIAGVLGSLCASGSERAHAQLVLLTERGSGSTYRVPDVEQMELPDALRRMEQAGIRPLVIEVPSDSVAAGLVVQQSPSPNAVVQEPSDVVLFVSRGIR